MTSRTVDTLLSGPADISTFFFFSSRRRHTRWPRDWSSDVCSSDLVHLGVVLQHFRVDGQPVRGRRLDHGHVAGARSEERRVGKESRASGSPSGYSTAPQLTELITSGMRLPPFTAYTPHSSRRSIHP